MNKNKFDVLYRYLFTSKEKAVNLAVEISSSSIKVLEVEPIRALSNIKVVSCAQETLPLGAVSSGNIADLEAIINSTQLLLSKNKLHAKELISCIPDAIVSFKEIEVSNLVISMSEIETILLGEFARSLGSNIQDLMIDFYKIRSKDNTNIFGVSGTRREAVDERVNFFEQVGFKTSILETDVNAKNVSLHHYLTWQKKENLTVCLIDCGATRTHIAMYKNAVPIFEKDISFGGNVLTHEIQSLFDMDYDKADSTKVKNALPSDFYRTTAQDFIDQYLTHIKRSIVACKTEKGVSPDYIVLCGGGAYLVGLLESIKKSFALPVDILDPFVGVSFGKAVNTQQVQKNSSSYFIAMGLLMRGLYD